MKIIVGDKIYIVKFKYEGKHQRKTTCGVGRMDLPQGVLIGMATTTTHSADHFSRREGRKHALAKAMKSPLHPTIETFVPETRKSIWDGFLQVCKPPIRKDVRVLLKEKAALETQNAALIKALADLENKTPVAVATTE